jgi:diaminopimelate decarboxylase
VDDARRLYPLAALDPALEIKGIACHIGSQITTVSPFLDAIQRILSLAKELSGEGIHLGHLDVGGGLGITYKDEQPPHPDEYGAAIKKALSGWKGEVFLEPGRVLVGNAGVLLTRVLYVKRSGKKRFVVVDAAMNDLVRPSYYDAHHEIEAVGAPREGAPEIVADVVGPICESSDFLARKRRMPEPLPGDLLAVRSAGAYGFAMSSNYNTRARAAEVLVDGGKATLARRRETWADLVRGERAAAPAPSGRAVGRGRRAAPPRAAPPRAGPRAARR